MFNKDVRLVGTFSCEVYLTNCIDKKIHVDVWTNINLFILSYIHRVYAPLSVFILKRPLLEASRSIWIYDLI